LKTDAGFHLLLTDILSPFYPSRSIAN